jgi:hypothetical protein
VAQNGHVSMWVCVCVFAACRVDTIICCLHMLPLISQTCLGGAAEALLSRRYTRMMICMTVWCCACMLALLFALVNRIAIQSVGGDTHAYKCPVAISIFPIARVVSFVKTARRQGGEMCSTEGRQCVCICWQHEAHSYHRYSCRG